MNATLDFLYRDELHNLRMIDIIRRFPECAVIALPKAKPRAVAVSRGGAEDWFLAASELRPLQDVIAELPERMTSCHVHQAWILDILQHRYALGNRGTTIVMTASADTFRPRLVGTVVELRPAHAEALRRLAPWADSDAVVERILGAPAAFGVIVEGRVVAKADVQQRTDRYYEINEVVVSPDHRRQGLGAGVASAAAQWILSQGGTPVYSAFAQNSPAVLLAESLGFRGCCSETCCNTALRNCTSQ
jgi:GNAT superfamily N-acetyltransferase